MRRRSADVSPRTLGHWLWGNMLDWKMPGQAVQFSYDKRWHRYDGELPGWTECGRWTRPENVKAFAGKGHKIRNPVAAVRGMRGQRFCVTCFAHELPVIDAVTAAMREERT